MPCEVGAVVKDGMRRLQFGSTMDVDTPGNDLPVRDPEQDVLDMVPVQESVSQSEFADTTQCILYDTHYGFISLWRDDLWEVSALFEQ
jgi:hypothetical protein